MLTNSYVNMMLPQFIEMDPKSVLWALETLGIIGQGEYYERHELISICEALTPQVRRSVYSTAKY